MTTAMRPKVGVILLNWNNYPDTKRCLDSLARVAYPTMSVYLVDNGSTDGSMDRLAPEYAGRNVIFIRNGENLGFSAGCNRGIARALEDGCGYVLLLNNDCIVFDPRFLDEAVTFAEARPECGIVGGKILFWPDTKRIWSTGGYIRLWGAETHIGYNELDAGQYDAIEERTFISGALMLIKRDVIDAIGMLPEVYFFGKEEWEYSTRAIKAGFRLFYNPQFRIYHEESHSHVHTDPTYVYNNMLSKILYKRRNNNRVFYCIWLFVFYCYLYVLFPVRFRIKRSRYVKGIDGRTIRSAMIAALRDSRNTEKISRETLDLFRGKHAARL